MYREIISTFNHEAQIIHY